MFGGVELYFTKVCLEMWWLYFTKCVWRCGGCTLLSVFVDVVVVLC